MPEDKLSRVPLSLMRTSRYCLPSACLAPIGVECRQLAFRIHFLDIIIDVVLRLHLR